MIHYITSDGLGQPWVGNELRELQRASIPFRLHAIRAPESMHFASEWADALNAQTNALYPLALWPMLQALILAPFLFGTRFLRGLANALFAHRENFRGRCAALSHFFVACYWARQLRRGSTEVSHIHSQWAYSSGTIGMYAAWLLDRSFSFTGHATDLFRDRVALKDKIQRADFIVCISEFHREFYLQEGARPEQLHIAYCGINPELFSVQVHQHTPDAPYRILSSGRLVEKKGFSDLIKACAILRDRDFNFRCVIAGSGPLGELHHEVKDLELAMGDPDRAHEMDSIVNRYGEVLDEYQSQGGYDLESRAHEVLQGLGFAPDQVAGDVGELSGGWKMRIGMAQVLLVKPEVLLMDEPTNHLDIESILWLEKFIRDYRGAVLLTCHDKDFMNRVVNRIVDIDGGEFISYTGDYDNYLHQRAVAEANREATYARQQAMLAKERRFVERFASHVAKAAQVQSRVKKLEKLDLVEPPRRRKVVEFQYRTPPRSGDDVAELTDVSKAYGDSLLLENMNF